MSTWTPAARPFVIGAGARPGTGGASLLSVLGRLAGMLRGFARRREVLDLARLDDRMLADIGLSRGDVDAALGTPWSGDPTAILADLSAERWHRTHARAERTAFDRDIRSRQRRTA